MAFKDKKSDYEAVTNMKRAITGELGRYFDDVVFTEHFFDEINDYNKIRKLIRLFFFDSNRMELWLSIVDEAEANGTELWNNREWVNDFRNTLILEYTRKIQATGDTFVIIADMLPYHRASKNEMMEALSWEDLLKQA